VIISQDFRDPESKLEEKNIDMIENICEVRKRFDVVELSSKIKSFIPNYMQYKIGGQKND